MNEEVKAIEQKGILFARSHITIVAVALLLLLAVGAAAIHLWVEGIRNEGEMRATIQLKEHENKDLQKQNEDADKVRDKKVADLEAQRNSIKSPRQAADYLRTVYVPTPTDSFPVVSREVAAPTAADPEAKKTVTEVSPEATERLANREISCQQTDTKLAACETKLANEVQMETNTRTELKACQRVKAPGFWHRVGTVLKVAIPAVAAGILLDRVIFHQQEAKHVDLVP